MSNDSVNEKLDPLDQSVCTTLQGILTETSKGWTSKNIALRAQLLPTIPKQYVGSQVHFWTTYSDKERYGKTIQIGTEGILHGEIATFYIKAVCFGKSVLLSLPSDAVDEVYNSLYDDDGEKSCIFLEYFEMSKLFTNAFELYDLPTSTECGIILPNGIQPIYVFPVEEDTIRSSTCPCSLDGKAAIPTIKFTVDTNLQRVNFHLRSSSATDAEPTVDPVTCSHSVSTSLGSSKQDMAGITRLMKLMECLQEVSEKTIDGYSLKRWNSLCTVLMNSS